MSQLKQKFKNTINAKKKPVQKFKNILIQPFPRYWPEIEDYDAAIFKEICLKVKNQFGDNFYLKNSNIFLGMNSTLRALKTDKKLSCLLISNEIKPKFIVTQIINYAIAKNSNTAILIVSKLKALTQEIFNISSLFVGFVSDKIPQIEEWIKLKSKSIPIPKEILQYYGQRISSNDAEEDLTMKTSLTKISDKIETVDFSKLYLIRNDKQTRVFQPENSKDLKPYNFENKTDCSDFISFSDRKSSEGVTVMDVDGDSEENIEMDKKILVDTIEKLTNKNNKVKIESETEYFKKFDNSEKDSEITEEPKVDENKQNTKNNRKKKKKNKRKLEQTDSTNNSDCIFKYMSLKVNRIQGNPDKSKKKKKK